MGANDLKENRQLPDRIDKPMPNVSFDLERIPVKPRIGLLTAISFVVGSIIGSGIFISPKGALVNSGSVGLSLVIWAASGVLTMLLSLTYAELGVMLPKSGGDYTIVKTGIGDIPAFLISWTATVVTNSGSRTVLALVFADYVCAPIFPCGAPNSIRKSMAAVQLLLLAITNTISVRLVSSLQNFFTLAKVLALICITTGGVVYLAQNGGRNLENSFDDSTNDVTSISLAIYSCMWAYGGYPNLNEIAEEIIEPKKNIPRALIISITLITCIYLTTNISYFAVLPKDVFLSSSAVAFTWGDKMLGSASILIPISVMCSVHGASNGGFFSDVRVRFAAARTGHLPEVLSFLHHKSRIPLVSLVLNTFLSLVLLIPGDISELINLVGFVGFLVQGLTMISYLRLRYQRRNIPKNPEDFRIPLFVPILALAICVFMLVSPFISKPRIEFLYGAGFILSGLLLYFPFVYFQFRIPGCDKFTTFTQLCLEVCPTILDKDLKI
ncbi:hypothetical protein ACF0H5_006050 [Mactra antiquata]